MQVTSPLLNVAISSWEDYKWECNQQRWRAWPEPGKKNFYNSNISVSKCLESAYISTFCSWKPLLGQDDPPNFNRFNIPRYPQRCFSPYQSVDASFLIGKWSTDVLRLAALATEPGNNNWCLAIPSPRCRLGRDYHVRFAPDQQRFECGYDQTHGIGHGQVAWNSYEFMGYGHPTIMRDP